MNGERLREIREKRQISQKDLADLVKVSDQQIYRYETGKSDPTGDVLKRLAQALEVSIDYLLGLVNDPSGHLREEDLSPMERKLIQAFRARRIVEASKAFTALVEEIDKAEIVTDKPAVDR